MTFNHPLRLSTMSSLIVLCLVAACGGGGAGGRADSGAGATAVSDSNATKAVTVARTNNRAAPVAVVSAAANAELHTDADAARLLTQATFGPIAADIGKVRTSGAAAWVDAQLAMPYDPSGSHLAYLRGRVAAGEPMHQNQLFSSFWKHAVTAPDQLRQRVALALSEIFVVSFASDLADRGDGVASYMDMLTERGLGSYRELLEGVARHPMMGLYLSHLGNEKEDPAKGRVPDENFAREVMQLFSIGLHRLNADGSLALDGAGQPVETYTMADVQGLAKVFTGWSWAGADKSYVRFLGYPDVADPNASFLPMQGYPAQHSTSEKRFLGVTIAPQSSADPEASLKVALDAIAAHPNVGPFIGRQLIQRLVTSNPSPAYVARIAAVFNDNGAGQRGDLKAVVRAILLDAEARDPALAAADAYGKVREPLLRMTAWMRAFGATSLSGRYLIRRTDDPATSIAQTVLYAPSVFNFFRPTYTPSASAAASAGLVAPEMQITDEVSAAGYVNTMITSVMWGFGSFNAEGRGDLQPSYATELGLVADPDALLQHLSRLLFADRMPDALKAQIKTAMASLPVGSSAEEQALFRLNRVQLAVLLSLVSPEFIIQK